MPDYRRTAERLLKTIGTNQFDRRDLHHLIRGFRASFLHYTRRSPGHWTHPRRRWHGHPDQPATAAPILLLFCRLHKTSSAAEETDALIERWFQFMAAVCSAYTGTDAAFLIPVLEEVILTFPEERHYPLLLSVLKNKMNEETQERGQATAYQPRWD